MKEDIYIINQLIHNIYVRYDEEQKINGKNIISHKKISGIENDYELVRVEINTRIDELKDIIGSINPKRIEFENNNEKLIANIYLTNHNKDIYPLTLLFDIDVYLVIDIYKPDYKKLSWSREDEIMKVLIIDLNKIDII